MIHVILGMHKSGTTLVAQMLHKSGINMGDFDESVSYDAGNKYERKEPLELNKEMLGCSYADFSLDVFRPVEKMVVTTDLQSKILNLVNSLNNRYSDWGFKDPRSCLTYSIWRDLLPEHRLIFVYRPPWEVCQHYIKNVPFYRILFKYIRSWKAAKVWYSYNTELLRYIENTRNKYIMINFTEFMKKSEAIQELQHLIDIPLVDCRNSDLYRAIGVSGFSNSMISLMGSVSASDNPKKLYQRLESLREASS